MVFGISGYVLKELPFFTSKMVTFKFGSIFLPFQLGTCKFVITLPGSLQSLVRCYPSTHANCVIESFWSQPLDAHTMVVWSRNVHCMKVTLTWRMVKHDQYEEEWDSHSRLTLFCHVGRFHDLGTCHLCYMGPSNKPWIFFYYS